MERKREEDGRGRKENEEEVRGKDEAERLLRTTKQEAAPLLAQPLSYLSVRLGD